MPHAVIILACLGVLLLLGAWERLARDRARRAVPIRIHVNGTRGKSTVTRLIWGALVEAGIPAVAKTTGTAARLLLPDGTERPVRRLAPPNIREQLWLLRQAHHAGARAVVAECMAIQPELQAISERQMLAATIGVITNVRTDHTDVMGRTLDDIAASLANATPRRGVLVVGDRPFLHVFERRAHRLGTRVVLASAEASPADRPSAADVDHDANSPASGWRNHNRALALAVTRELHIPDEVALRGMAKARPDPGAVTTGTLNFAGRSVPFVDATAANDPESLDLLLADLQAGNELPPGGSHLWTRDAAGLIVVYNHRADRPERFRCFAARSTPLRRAAHVLVTGDRPSLTLLRLVRRCRNGRLLHVAARSALVTDLARLVVAAPAVETILFCGNAKRLDVSSLFGAQCFTNAQDPIPDS